MRDAGGIAQRLHSANMREMLRFTKETEVLRNRIADAIRHDPI